MRTVITAVLLITVYLVSLDLNNDVSRRKKKISANANFVEPV